MVNKLLLFVILSGCSCTASDAELPNEWWRDWKFGAPCTTKIDIIENTCNLKVSRKPNWNKK